jgi:hypothetical protein
MDFRAGHFRVRHERRHADQGQPPPGQPDRRQSGLLVIRWRNLDGTESGGHPLPRAQAEALLRAFQDQFPRPRYWLEVPPALAEPRVPAPPGRAEVERSS